MSPNGSLQMNPESSCRIDTPSAIRAKLKLLLGCALIAVTCFVAYSPAIKGDFIWDDDRYVTANPLIVAPDGLWRIWFSTDVPSQYFPLVYTTFRFEYQLWGFNPMPYHITNIAIHIISSLLLWSILRRLAIPAAFVAAAIFALHPVNVESVAWITERKNVLMLVFSLLSVLFWIDFSLRTQTRRRAALFYVLSLLCYMLSLLSKTTACVLPVALVLIIWLKGIPFNARRLLPVAPYVALGLAMGLLTMWWEHHHQGTGLVNLGLGSVERVLIATRAVWFYAAKILFPINLAFSYPRWNINSADPSQYVWLLACLLTAGGLWLWRKALGRGVIAAILFFVATLFPVLGFFDLYTFVYAWVADHYQYMASIGLITLASAIGSRLFARLGEPRKILAPVTAAAVLLVLAVLSWRQSCLYQNSEILWRDTLRKNPNSWLVHNNLGQVLMAQNKLDEAILHVTRSLELAEVAPAVHPSNIAAAHFNFALIFRAQHKYQNAIEQFRRVLDIDPNDTEAHCDLADVLESQGQLDEAVAHYNQALQIDPEVAMVHFRLAGALLKKGDIHNAITHLQRAIDIKPDYVLALANLVEISVNQAQLDIRRETKAVEFAERAVQRTNRTNPVVLNLLAMAYAAENQYDQAIIAAEEAMKLAADADANDLVEVIRTQLESYKKQLK
jgi:tetratricopeptide (TPR) repeat protein